ncbi:hypothetical protein PGT21_002389 [Puccinia graminis f. sp. tritici]|uniref:Uncharacterized protein n=1 Tax=Puccinia graminis f. sp. tritici TaxID=56615 RepID=A0A5B0Q4Z2_PUCGR|nr:hypothetical protein PGT21_002389 [Puccinia graminis f. sp. tritici]
MPFNQDELSSSFHFTPVPPTNIVNDLHAYLLSTSPKEPVNGLPTSPKNGAQATELVKEGMRQMVSELNAVKETLSKSATMLANRIEPANPTNDVLDRITTVPRYFPDLHEETYSFINDMSFDDRALLSSTTIDRNEAYQSTSRDLLSYESRIIKELLTADKSVFSKTYESVERIEKALFENRNYRQLNSKAVQKRIKRIKCEMAIELVEKNVWGHTKTAQPSTSRAAQPSTSRGQDAQATRANK